MVANKTKKALVPKLRFKEFDDNWKSETLMKLVDINPTSRNLPESFIYIDLESVFKGQLLKENVITKIDAPSRAQRLLKENDILFQTVRPYQMNNLYFDKQGAYVASTGYAQLRSYQNSKYIYQYLHRQNFVDSVIEKCTGTSYPSINSSDLGKIKLHLPTLPEQQKIAAFLSAVDEKIQLLTRKKELLEQYKKGVMQQLLTGKLRFKIKNEVGELVEPPKWEEKRLGDFMFERNIQAPKSDKYPLMAFMQNVGVAPKGERYNREFLVNDEDNKKYKKTEYGDFIYSSNNLDTGSIGLNRYGPASISPVYSIFHTDKTCDYNFVSEYFTRREFISKMIRFRQGVVYGQWRIHESEFLKIIERIPCLLEQQKIASFLTTIDTQIENVSKQITQTQSFKKGLLQQMFV